MKKFIILSSKRSGSTYLQQLLNSHPEIIVGGEIFNNSPGHVMEKEQIPEDKVKLKDSNPEEYLNWYFLSRNKDPVKFIGFRLFYEHGRSGREVIWDILKNIPDFRIIHLQRKNQLKQFLSLKLAKKTSQWLRQNTDKPIKYEPIFLKIKECRKYFRRQQRKTDRALLFFGKTKRLDISYEDLATNPNSETDKVLNFLGLRSTELTCKTW